MAQFEPKIKCLRLIVMWIFESPPKSMQNLCVPHAHFQLTSYSKWKIPSTPVIQNQSVQIVISRWHCLASSQTHKCSTRDTFQSVWFRLTVTNTSHIENWILHFKVMHSTLMGEMCQPLSKKTNTYFPSELLPNWCNLFCSKAKNDDWIFKW